MTKAEIQLVRSLDDKKGRAAAGLFAAEGAKLVGEMLTSELRVQRVFALEEAADRFPGAETISRKEMERISVLKTPTEVVALVEIPAYRLEAEALRGSLALALDGVQDPGNLGTIIRLADWFGIRDVICSENSADCFNPKVVQASMGAVARVRVHYTPLEPFLRQAAAFPLPVYGTFLNGEDLHTAELSAEGILVMGSEGRGISSGVEKHVGRRLYIPPWPREAPPASESLNVASAAAIVCAEFRRERPGRKKG